MATITKKKYNLGALQGLDQAKTQGQADAGLIPSTSEIKPSTSGTVASTSPVNTPSTSSVSSTTQGVTPKYTEAQVGGGIASKGTPRDTGLDKKVVTQPGAEQTPQTGQTTPINSNDLVTGGQVTTEQKLQYEQEGLQNDQLNIDLLGAAKTVEEAQYQKDYQTKQEQNRLQREGLQVQNAEIASSQRIQQAGQQLDNLRQNIAYIGNMGRPAKSMVQLDAMKNQVSTAEQTFRELVQVEDNLRTIQKLGIDYNATAFENQMKNLQDQLDTQVGTTLQGIITDFNKEAQGIDTMDELNALREKWLDTADTSLEAITNRNFIDRQNRIEQFQSIITDKKAQIVEQQKQEAEFAKNANILNKDMSDALGYYVNGNGQAIVSATTGQPIRIPPEAPMDPVFDMKSGKLITFTTGENGQILTTVDQVIDQPQFSSQVIQSMITAVSRGTMTAEQALEILPPDAQQQFLAQIGSVQQQVKPTTPDWKQDANGNYYDANSTINPAQQTGTGGTTSASSLISKWEGFRENAYPDPATGGAPWTIGFGFTSLNGQPVKPGDKIDRASAEVLLEQEISQRQKFMNYITVPLNENQKAALSSFEFNLGSGIWDKNAMPILNKINQGDIQGAANLMKQYVNANGKPMQGLVNRRNEEAGLLMQQPSQQQGGDFDLTDITVFNGMTPSDRKKTQNDPLYNKFVDAKAKVMNDKDANISDIMKFSMGGNSINQTQETQLSKYAQGVEQLDGIQQSLKSSLTGPVVGKIRSMNPYDTNAQTIKAQLTALVPTIARGAYGEVGVLTDADVELYKQTIPNLTATNDLNDALLAFTLKSLANGYKTKLRSIAGGGFDVSGYSGEFDRLTSIADSLLAGKTKAPPPNNLANPTNNKPSSQANADYLKSLGIIQ